MILQNKYPATYQQWIPPNMNKLCNTHPVWFIHSTKHYKDNQLKSLKNILKI